MIYAKCLEHRYKAHSKCSINAKKKFTLLRWALTGELSIVLYSLYNTKWPQAAIFLFLYKFSFNYKFCVLHKFLMFFCFLSQCYAVSYLNAKFDYTSIYAFTVPLFLIWCFTHCGLRNQNTVMVRNF